MSRCKAKSRELNVRCVRRDGHKMSHAYPNDFMQRIQPDYWRALQNPSVTLNLDEITFNEGQRSQFDFERIESSDN